MEFLKKKKKKKKRGKGKSAGTSLKKIQISKYMNIIFIPTSDKVKKY